MENTTIKKLQPPFSISLRQIGLLIIAFLLGFASFGLFQNILRVQALSFSTPALIGFVLSILLAGASIVLAISAIMLGKFSEQAMIQRSDESIRLQNEVFQKTTDALQRIESSTGVTEKRIEDIISGRVGDISHRIAEIATKSQKGVSKKSFSDIEQEVRNSLLQSLQENISHVSRQKTKEELERKRKEEEERENNYQSNHQKVMAALANRENLKVQKAGHGTPTKSGEELFDGIFIMQNGGRIGVSTFRDDFPKDVIQDYVKNALNELHVSNMQLVYLVIFTPNEEQQQAFDECLRIVDPDLKNRISLIVVAPDEVERVISQLELSNRLAGD